MNIITETIQYGYKEQSSCIDALRAVNNFLKEDKNGELLLMDLSKAFDTIDRSLLWTALFRKGTPIKLIRILMEGRKETLLRVKNKGTYGPEERTSRGVFQGAAFSALGFIIYLCDMLDDSQALNDTCKVNNVYNNLPTGHTRENISRQRVCRQAGLSRLPVFPMLPKHVQRDVDKRLIKYLEKKH